MPADYVDCPPPSCVIVHPAPETGETAPPTDIELGLEELVEGTLDSIVAATGWGLETRIDPDAAAGIERRRLVETRSGTGPPGGFDLSYLVAGDPAGRRVLFLHGSPGEAAEWADFLASPPPHLEYVAVDRPGFGGSGPDTADASLAGQARRIAPLLVDRDGERTIVVGYSYGGPLAIRLALDYPDKVAGLVLIGAAVDPALEETSLLQDIAALPPFADLLPADLEAANAELLALPTDLNAIAPRLATLARPVLVIHGMADTLVPVGNVAYMRERLTRAWPLLTVLIEDGDHFLPWNAQPLLKEHILRLVRIAVRLGL